MSSSDIEGSIPFSMADGSVDLDEDAFAGGLSDPTTMQFRQRRQVLDIINKLHSYGYDSFTPA